MCNLKQLFSFLFISIKIVLFGQQSRVDSIVYLLNDNNNSFKSDTTKLNCLNELKIAYLNLGSDSLTLNTVERIFDLANSILANNNSSEVERAVQKVKADSYYTIGGIYRNHRNYILALENYKRALKIEENLGRKIVIAQLYSKIGYTYKIQNNYAMALSYYKLALNLFLWYGKPKEIAAIYNDIGNVYSSLAIYDEAITAHYNSLRIAESIKDSTSIARSYNNIGNIYDNKGDLKKALDNHFMSLKIKTLIADKYGIGVSYGNIGAVYEQEKKWDDALKMYLSSLEAMLTFDDKRSVAVCYNNLGVVYYQMHNYNIALKQYILSENIRKELADSVGLSGCYGNMGDVYFKQNNYAKAENYLLESKRIAAKYNHYEYLKHSCSSLTNLYKAIGKYKEALENYQLYTFYKDSIDGEISGKRIIETQMTYDFEKKEAIRKMKQEKKDILANQELKQKEQQRNYFIIGFLLVVLFSVFIFKEYREKQKANLVIIKQKEEVELAKHIIEEKNKDITDSINYATNIQQAILPLHEDIYSMFPESFILFKPKDIVSGDFYFFFKKDNAAYIAAADCTGHGVPGAFMSLIGSEKLKDAARETHDTSIVLQRLNQEMKRALKQSENVKSTRDGMDIALCLFDKDKNELSYSGANRPLWIVKKQGGELIEIKATKAAIGGFTDTSQIFDRASILLEKGDTFYLSTDGYADQFGGKETKKLMVKRFKEQLLNIQHLSMAEQLDFLNNFIVDWKGNNEQVDDILIIGVRV